MSREQFDIQDHHVSRALLSIVSAINHKHFTHKLYAESFSMLLKQNRTLLCGWVASDCAKASTNSTQLYISHAYPKGTYNTLADVYVGNLLGEYLHGLYYQSESGNGRLIAVVLHANLHFQSWGTIGI